MPKKLKKLNSVDSFLRKGQTLGFIEFRTFNFLRSLSTEFSCFNFSDILTFLRLPGNQNYKLPFFLHYLKNLAIVHMAKMALIITIPRKYILQQPSPLGLAAKNKRMAN